MESVNVDAVMDAAAQLGVILAAAGGGLYAIKRWIKKVVAEPLMEQVQPNGGSQDTTRHLIETLVNRQEDFHVTLEEHVTASDGRYDQLTDQINKAMSLALEAVSVANNTSHRIDLHLERGGHE